jgi:hypothetical protein
MSNQLPLLNGNKPVTTQSCNSIYWNLIELLEPKNNTITSSSFIRELWQTARCDSIAKDLSQHRKTIEESLGKDVVQRVLAYDETTKDQTKTNDVMYHYNYFTRKLLVEGLTPSSKLYYYTLHQPERFVGSITGLTAFAGLGVWLQNQHKLVGKRKI